MPFKFLMSAILTGHIDAYCLVCESHLRNTDDIQSHVAKPIHIKNLDATGYFEKYKDDCVRKVKKGYFCEFCNTLISTSAKVGLHIAEPKHIKNKGSQCLKRIGNSIIAFDNVLISEKAWNSLIEDTCALCSMEFENEGIHKTDAMHIINLIQGKLDFAIGNAVYRMIDDSSFQCLTCNMVFALNTFNTHFDHPDHKKLYSECQQAYINSNVFKQKEKLEIPQPSAATVKEQKPDPNDEVKKEIVNSQKPESLINIKEEIPEVSAIRPVTPKPKPKLEKVTQDLDDEVCKALKAKNYIALDENGSKWCLLCDWTMDPTSVNTHIEGKHHQTILKMHKERLQKKKAIELDEKPEPAKKEEKVQEPKTPTVDMLPAEWNDGKLDFHCQVAFCMKCNKNLDFNHAAITNHDHKKDEQEETKETASNTNKAEDKKKTPNKVENTKKPQSPTTKKATLVVNSKKQEKECESLASSASSSRETDDDIEKLAKANNLVFNRDSNRIYCPICDTRVPSTIRNINQHTSGVSHKNNVAMKAMKPSLKQATIKTSMKDFIKDVVAVESGSIRDLVINCKYVLNYYSFIMITKEYYLRCQPCQVDLNIEQVESHRGTLSHHSAMSETKIIVSIESEFIRELRPEVYHCGYCNVIQTGYEDLEKHFQTRTHREAKTSSMWRLQQYLPDIVTYRQQNPPNLVAFRELLRFQLNVEEQFFGNRES